MPHMRRDCHSRAWNSHSHERMLAPSTNGEVCMYKLMGRAHAALVGGYVTSLVTHASFARSLLSGHDDSRR